jgi:hypothetical protein
LLHAATALSISHRFFLVTRKKERQKSIDPRREKKETEKYNDNNKEALRNGGKKKEKGSAFSRKTRKRKHKMFKKKNSIKNRDDIEKKGIKSRLMGEIFYFPPEHWEPFVFTPSPPGNPHPDGSPSD